MALLLILSGCELMGFHSWQWHQKLAVSVDTPEGTVSGTSVTVVELSLSPKWAGVGDFAGAASYSLKGEAVVVEVSPGRYLFALLKDYNHETAVKTFIPPDERARTRQESIEMFDGLEALRQTERVPSDLYPLLVTFDDINDPASVKKVDPQDLEATFGPGYRLNFITLTMSDGPMTEGKVDGVLGWLGDYYSQLLDGNSVITIEANNRLANSLGAGAFDTEGNR